MAREEKRATDLCRWHENTFQKGGRGRGRALETAQKRCHHHTGDTGRGKMGSEEAVSTGEESARDLALLQRPIPTPSLPVFSLPSLPLQTAHPQSPIDFASRFSLLPHPQFLPNGRQPEPPRKTKPGCACVSLSHTPA